MTEWAGWVPIRIYGRDGEPWLDWCLLDEHGLDQPFFDQSVERMLDDPFGCLFRRQEPLAALIERNPDPPAPSGLIFHMTRCGSTLAAQMLACNPDHVVVSEPHLLVKLMETLPPEGADADARVEWLRAVCGAWATACGPSKKLFIKLDASHTTELATIQAAFPAVPWIFIHRDPVEVLVSHSREPLWMLDPTDEERNTAHKLRQICEAAVEAHRPPQSRLLDYRELIPFVLDELPDHFGFVCDDMLRAAMAERTQRHGKFPGNGFTGDTGNKQATATDAIRAAAAELAGVTEALKTASATTNRTFERGPTPPT